MTTECFETVKYPKIASWQTKIKKHRDKRDRDKKDTKIGKVGRECLSNGRPPANTWQEEGSPCPTECHQSRLSRPLSMDLLPPEVRQVCLHSKNERSRSRHSKFQPKQDTQTRFYSCDLDINPMTLYEPDLKILTMYTRILKLNFLGQGFKGRCSVCPLPSALSAI